MNHALILLSPRTGRQMLYVNRKLIIEGAELFDLYETTPALEELATKYNFDPDMVDVFNLDPIDDTRYVETYETVGPPRLDYWHGIYAHMPEFKNQTIEPNLSSDVEAALHKIVGRLTFKELATLGLTSKEVDNVSRWYSEYWTAYKRHNATPVVLRDA